MRFPGDDHVVHLLVAIYVTHHMKRVRVFQAVQQFAAFLPAIGVEHHGIDLPDVGIDSVAQQQHLQQRNDQREKYRREITPYVQRLFIKYGAESAEHFTHAWPPLLSRRWPGSCTSIPRTHLPGWAPAGESPPPRCL